jgi:hypothetical protein
MTPEAILLSIRDRSGEGSYRFSCPRCMDLIEKPADRKVAALLLSAGVEIEDKDPEVEEEPAEEEIVDTYPERRPEGPPLTVDDLIGFHFLIKDDERLYRALLEH